MRTMHLKQEILQYKYCANHTIQLTDFHPVNTATDPTQLQSSSFEGYVKPIWTVSLTIRPDTMAPITILPAHQYPDERQSTTAYDPSLRKLYREGVFDWSQRLPLGANPLPLTVLFCYNWAHDGKISNPRRAAFFVAISCARVHYDPTQITAPRHTKRLLY